MYACTPLVYTRNWNNIYGHACDCIYMYTYIYQTYINNAYLYIHVHRDLICTLICVSSFMQIMRVQTLAASHTMYMYTHVYASVSR